FQTDALFSEQLISSKFLNAELIPKAYDTDTSNWFPLFALIKLNFSLLTASDYLATHDYSSGMPTTDFGVLNNRVRVLDIVQAMRTTQAHNKKLFDGLDQFVSERESLVERSKDNLNKLRTEMAVELV